MIYFNRNGHGTEQIDLHGDELQISVCHHDTETVYWEGLAWECPVFMELMPENFLLLSNKDLALFIEGYEDQIIAWAQAQGKEELKLKRA